jgi:hypothetical protein
MIDAEREAPGEIIAGRCYFFRLLVLDPQVPGLPARKRRRRRRFASRRRTPALKALNPSSISARELRVTRGSFADVALQVAHRVLRFTVTATT